MNIHPDSVNTLCAYDRWEILLVFMRDSRTCSHTCVKIIQIQLEDIIIILSPFRGNQSF